MVLTTVEWAETLASIAVVVAVVTGVLGAGWLAKAVLYLLGGRRKHDIEELRNTLAALREAEGRPEVAAALERRVSQLAKRVGGSPRKLENSAPSADSDIREEWESRRRNMSKFFSAFGTLVGCCAIIIVAKPEWALPFGLTACVVAVVILATLHGFGKHFFEAGPMAREAIGLANRSLQQRDQALALAEESLEAADVVTAMAAGFLIASRKEEPEALSSAPQGDSKIVTRRVRRRLQKLAEVLDGFGGESAQEDVEASDVVSDVPGQGA